MASTKAKPKLYGRAFYESIGSPKFVVAPMVDQSEFAWRMLTRSFLTRADNARLLAYTPMFHARLFDETPKYRDSHFQATRPSSTAPLGDAPPESTPFLDGNPRFDRPLFVQFCANDPAHLLNAAQLAAPYCDAVDLNLGCPQGIARKGHYGAFLQEDQDLVYRLINNLHKHLPVPVTAKIRILETKEDTLAYAKNVLAAGASIITVHGRRRDQKGHLTGVADWEYIRYLRENLPEETVIFANGNILQHDDLERCLAATGADAIMSAEGNLSDPGIFATAPPVGYEGREYWRGRDGKGGWRVDAVFRRYMDIIHRHVLEQEPPSRRPLFIVGDDENWLQQDVVQDVEQEEEGPARKKRKKDSGGASKKYEPSPNIVAIRPHLFHLLRHFVSRHTDIRDILARCHVGDIPAFENVLNMVERRVAAGLAAYEKTDGKSLEEEPELKPNHRAPGPAKEGGEGEAADPDYDPESSVVTVKMCKRPWWIAQPIVRPLPKEALAKGSISLSKKDRKKLEEAAAAAAVATETATEISGSGQKKEPTNDSQGDEEDNKKGDGKGVEDGLQRDSMKEPPIETKSLRPDER
ncbi:hypothetical protein F5X99DRAFT_385194 [Biscogniauxia marginata]|nr:hypothetical protein F5X99DRAFT_385194 [Biscogniauxia marginata]